MKPQRKYGREQLTFGFGAVIAALAILSYHMNKKIFPAHIQILKIL
jgi:hypothetical protein